MDGGAYCTLTPVVLSRGAIHAGGPYRCPNVRIRARATRTNTPPNGAFRGFGAPQTEFAAETHLNRIAEALEISPLEIRRRNVYVARRHDPDRPGPARAAWPARRSSSGPPRPASSMRLRARNDAERGATSGLRHRCPGSPLRTGRERMASGIGLALAWHGAGFTGSGEVKLASVASLELTAEGAIRILTASTEMGQGTKTIFPQLVADALGVPVRGGRARAAGHGLRPRFGADRRVADGDGRRWPADQGGPAAAGAGRDGHAAARSRPPTATTPGRTAPLRIDQRFEPYPGVGFDDDDVPRRRLPGLRLGGLRRAASTSISIPARSTSGTSSPPTTSGASSTRSWPRARSRAARSRPSATPRSRRSSCATAATSTTGWRPTSSRPRSTRRGSRRSWSRRRSTACRTARRGSGSCRWTSGRRRWSPRSPMRPGSGSPTCRPARSGSWPALSGVAGVAPLPTGRLGAGRRRRAGPMTAFHFTVNADARRGRRPGDAPPARRPARGPRP